MSGTIESKAIQNLKFDFEEYNGSRSGQLISVENSSDTLQIKGIRITTNADIASPWGSSLADQWPRAQKKEIEEKELREYELKLDSPLTLTPGTNKLLIYSTGKSLGPLEDLPMPPQKVEIFDGTNWTEIGLANVKPTPENSTTVKMYFTDWGQYGRQHTSANIPWFSVDGAVYSFFGFDESGKVFTLDSWGDELELPNFALHKRKNPTLKMTGALGGWTNAGQRMDTIYSKMAENPSARANFVKNAVRAVRQAQIDGIDIDWEYATPQDANNFVLLMQELRAELAAKIGPQARLTFAAPAGQENIVALTKEQWGKIAAVVDEAGVMTYDYFGAWDPTVDFLAPWNFDPASPHAASKYCIKDTLELYQARGIGLDKFELGFPNYARAVIVDSPGPRAGLYQKNVGTPKGDSENGIYSWDTINKLLNKQPSNLDALGVKEWFFYDSDHPFCKEAGMCLLSGALPDGRWVVMSFLDQKAATQRAQDFKKLGGTKTMVWSNDSEPYDEKQTITKAIADGIRNPAPELTSTAIAATPKLISKSEFLKNSSITAEIMQYADYLRGFNKSKTKSKILLTLENKSSKDLGALLKEDPAGKKLETHRNLVKRFFAWLLPEGIIAKPKSFQIADRFYKMQQVLESEHPPTRIISANKREFILESSYQTILKTTSSNSGDNQVPGAGPSAPASEETLSISIPPLLKVLAESNPDGPSPYAPYSLPSGQVYETPTYRA